MTATSRSLPSDMRKVTAEEFERWLVAELHDYHRSETGLHKALEHACAALAYATNASMFLSSLLCLVSWICKHREVGTVLDMRVASAVLSEFLREILTVKPTDPISMETVTWVCVTRDVHPGTAQLLHAVLSDRTWIYPPTGQTLVSGASLIDAQGFWRIYSTLESSGYLPQTILVGVSNAAE